MNFQENVEFTQNTLQDVCLKTQKMVMEKSANLGSLSKQKLNILALCNTVHHDRFAVLMRPHSPNQFLKKMLFCEGDGMAQCGKKRRLEHQKAPNPNFATYRSCNVSWLYVKCLEYDSYSVNAGLPGLGRNPTMTYPPLSDPRWHWENPRHSAMRCPSEGAATGSRRLTLTLGRPCFLVLLP